MRVLGEMNSVTDDHDGFLEIKRSRVDLFQREREIPLRPRTVRGVLTTLKFCQLAEHSAVCLNSWVS